MYWSKHTCSSYIYSFIQFKLFNHLTVLFHPKWLNSVLLCSRRNLSWGRSCGGSRTCLQAWAPAKPTTEWPLTLCGIQVRAGPCLPSPPCTGTQNEVLRSNITTRNSAYCKKMLLIIIHVCFVFFFFLIYVMSTFWIFAWPREETRAFSVIVRSAFAICEPIHGWTESCSVQSPSQPNAVYPAVPAALTSTPQAKMGEWVKQSNQEWVNQIIILTWKVELSL